MPPASSLTLKVLTPEGLVLEKKGLVAVTIPLADRGPIGIRDGHAPLIAETEQGNIYYRSDISEEKILLHAGVLDVRDNSIILLTAGEVEKTPEAVSQSGPTEYDRLMQTLIRQIQQEDETEHEKNE